MEIIIDSTADDLMFMQEVSKRVRGFGRLPFDVPKDAMPSIIKDAAFWFAENSMQAVIEKNYSISYDGSGEIVVPPNIIAVNFLDFMGGSGGFGGVMASDSALANTRKLAISPLLYSSNYDSVINSNAKANFQYDYTDVLMMMSEISMMDNINRDYIQYRHNHNTSKIYITSLSRSATFGINVYEMIPLAALYTDRRFIKYVTAKVLEDLEYILSYFNFTSIGDVEINYDSISKKAEKMIEGVVEDVENDDNPIIISE